MFFNNIIIESRSDLDSNNIKYLSQNYIIIMYWIINIMGLLCYALCITLSMHSALIISLYISYWMLFTCTRRVIVFKINISLVQSIVKVVNSAYWRLIWDSNKLGFAIVDDLCNRSNRTSWNQITLRKLIT